MSSIYFSSNPRSTNSREKARLTNGLPSYSAAIQEKLYRHGRSTSWLIPLSTPLPGIRDRRLRLWVPNPARIHQVSVARFGRKRGTLVLCFGVFLFVYVTFAVHKRFNSSTRQWPTFPTGDPPTLVFTRADLQQIWRWEIDSGHYPSSQKSTLWSTTSLILNSEPGGLT
jgi:WD repeat and SOF domain-containing protein 1